MPQDETRRRKYVLPEDRPGSPTKEETKKDEGKVKDSYQHSLAAALRVLGPIAGTYLGGLGGATLGATEGAVEGGVVGSALPGAGTAIGAGTGGILGGISGATAGKSAGGAAGGYLAELLAQMAEPGGMNRPFNQGRAAVTGVLGAIPVRGMMSAGKRLVSAAKGGLIGTAGMAGYKLADKEENALKPWKWSHRDLIAGPVVGGLTSAAFAGKTPKALPPPPSAPPTEAELTLARRQRDPRWIETEARDYKNLQDVQEWADKKREVAGKTGDKAQVAFVKDVVDTSKAQSAAEKLLAQEQAAVDKIQAGAMKDKADTNKAQAAAEKLVGNEKKAAGNVLNNLFKSAMDRKESGAAKLDLLQDQFGAANAKRNVQFADERSKANQNAINLARIEANKEGRVPTEPSVGETISAKTPEGDSARSSTRWVKPEPKEGGGGGGGDNGLDPRAQLTKEDVGSTLFSTKEKATEAGSRTGGRFRVDTIDRGKHRVVFYNDAAPPTEPPMKQGFPGKMGAKVDAILEKYGSNPPEEPPPTGAAPIPATPKPKGPPSGGGAAAPITAEQILTRSKKMTKAEAFALAKHLGGVPHQVSPKQWKVIYPDAAIPKPPPVEELPQPPPPDEPPPAPFKPATPYVPETGGPPKITPGSDFDPGGLTREEFTRFNDLRPIMNGPKLTPAETAEFNALRDKRFPRSANVAEPTIAPTPEEAPLTVPELAKAIDTEGAKPIAEVPFSLGREAAKPKGVQSTLPGQPGEAKPTKQQVFNEPLDPAFEAMLDKRAGEEGGVPKINPLGHGALPTEPPAPVAEPPAAPTARTGKYSPEATAKLDELGAAYRAETDPVKKRELGKALGKAGAEAKAELAAKSEPIPPKVGEIDSADLSKLPPEEQAKAIAAEFEKYKKEKGAINPALLIKGGSALAGATIGGATDEEDPLRGMLIGAGAGLAAGGLISKVRAVGPNTPPTQATSLANTVKKEATRAGHMAGDAYRAFILTNIPNLPINIYVGPWGGAIMGAAEATIARKPWGAKALVALLNPINFIKEVRGSKAAAGNVIEQVQSRAEGLASKDAPKWFQKVAGYPGNLMTRGDIAAKRILMGAGASEAEAKAITLTNEPVGGLGRGVSAFRKGAKTAGGKASPVAPILLPFYRTVVNQFESSLARTPGLGVIYQHMAQDAPDPKNIIIAQQILGTTTMAAAYALGTVVPVNKKTQILADKLISNAGGQYGMLWAAAFHAGQASQSGAGAGRQIAAGIFEGAQSLPLPTTKPINDIGVAIRNFSEGKYPEPESLIPQGVRPSTWAPIFGGLVAPFAGGTQDEAAPQQQTGTGRRRYVLPE